jgi:hypothetical protein
VDFVFDSDKRHQRRFDLMLPKMKHMKSMDGKFVNAIRRDERKFLPLQAGDLLAWQIRRFCEPNHEPPQKHFYAARDCRPKKHELFIVDRAMLVNMVQDMRETASKLARSLGRSPDVRTWK